MNKISSNKREHDIFKRDISGEIISSSDENYHYIKDVIIEAQQIVAELNANYHSNDEVQEIFSRLTDSEIDKSFSLLPPFYTDFGKNIKVGKNVFINHACTFMDRGGITLYDDVYIGPKVSIITTNHPTNPAIRHSTISKPIIIKRNVWIGANAIIMPGITIGENSIVAAGAIVTKDVDANSIVAGVPAKVIKTI